MPVWDRKGRTERKGIRDGNQSDFDPPVAAVSAQQGSSAPGPVVQGGGPTGQFLRLVNNNVNSQSNHYAYDLTDPGAFSTITADFDLRTSGGSNPADGMGFMLLPTATYGTTGVGPSGYFDAEDPNLADTFAIGVDLYPANQGVNDVAVHWNGAEVRNFRLNPSQVDIDSGAFHRIHAEIQQIAPPAPLSPPSSNTSMVSCPTRTVPSSRHARAARTWTWTWTTSMSSIPIPTLRRPPSRCPRTP